MAGDGFVGKLKLLSVGQVADLSGVSASSVRLLCDTGKLPSVRPLGPNGHRKIRQEAVDEYLRSIEQPAVRKPTLVLVDEEYQPGPTLAETIAAIKKQCK